ncbi:LADA_0G13828g1_1 [Lachancea dasiensis]|uniref:LADA_0G13828g1_1 n=1 Tax=Lachancea dasiensis TaxID=1072105 RepID=A0A1G4JVS3_9SACH|nr:LADA_0G13828g1_1 [Lachancea dasiensis]
MGMAQLTTFELLFPLPQRCILLMVAGLWLWLFQISILHRAFRIDISQLVLSHNSSEISPRIPTTRLIQNTRQIVQRITKIILPWYAATCFLLHKCNGDSNYATEAWILCLLNIQPLCQFIAIFAMVLDYSPMVLRCFKKILCFGNIESKPLRNNYILLTDSLTSFGKPLIDFGLYISHLVSRPFDEKCIVDRSSHGQVYHLDLIIGITPVMLRLSQCLREFQRSKSSGQSKNALYNAVKYSLNLPVLACTVHARMFPNGSSTNKVYWFMMVSSIYGFWWDLTMDWNLGMFNFSSKGMDRNEFLRSRTLFPQVAYCIAICTDFAIKFAWLWELMLGRSVFKGEANIFFLQSLELFRRWVWTFVKLEAEAVNLEGVEKMED